MWPFVNGRETKWRYNAAIRSGRQGPVRFLRQARPSRLDLVPALRAAARVARTREYPFWLNTGRVVEHWHTGSMTRRIPVLHQAVPARVRRAASERRQPARHRATATACGSRLAAGTLVLPAQIDGRARPPEGQVFVPFFDESLLINELTLDAFCPISKQPDYKKCAVRVERA